MNLAINQTAQPTTIKPTSNATRPTYHRQKSAKADDKPNKAYKSKSKPTANRLINTKGLSRQAWLEVRRQGIGSSDASSACGVNPYQSMLELWMIKTGRLSDDLDSDPNGYAPLYWGNQLEPLVAKYYQQHTGNKVRRVNAILQHPEPEYDFMLANLDYEVVGCDEVQILECKTAGQYGAKLWQDGVPLYVSCQVQHQLAVTGKQSAHICVLLCGHEAKLFKVERDEALIKQLMRAEKQFWQYVIDDTPPPADHSESASRAIKALYPKHTPSKQVDFSDDATLNQLFDTLITCKATLAEQERQFDEAKHQLQSAMQDAEIATFANGSVSWKRSKDSVSLDSKALLKEQPDLLDKYPKVRQGSRRFVVNPA